MAKKKVLVTFDYKTNPGITEDDSFIREMVNAIPESEVKVGLPDFSKTVNENVNRMEKEMDEADLIVHDGFNFQRSVPYSEDAESFEKKLSELVLKRFGGKSVFFNIKATDAKPIEMAVKKETAYLSVPAVDLANPVFPLVLNLGLHGGHGVHLIEDKETFDKAFNSNDEDGPKKEDYHFSRYIETPSEYFTHYRLLYVRDKLIGAGLIVSNHKKTDDIRLVHEGEYTWGSNMFKSRESPYFLNSKKITSNAAQEGRIIPLNNGRKLNAWEQQILREHNLDPENIVLPEELVRKSLDAARIAEKHGILIQGQDWLQDKKINFNLLEINHLPEMKLVLHLFNNGKGTTHDMDRIGGKEIAKRIHRTMK